MTIDLLEEKIKALNEKVYYCSKELAELNKAVQETRAAYDRFFAAVAESETAETGGPHSA